MKCTNTFHYFIIKWFPWSAPRRPNHQRQVSRRGISNVYMFQRFVEGIVFASIISSSRVLSRDFKFWNTVNKWRSKANRNRVAKQNNSENHCFYNVFERFPIFGHFRWFSEGIVFTSVFSSSRVLSRDCKFWNMVNKWRSKANQKRVAQKTIQKTIAFTMYLQGFQFLDIFDVFLKVSFLLVFFRPPGCCRAIWKSGKWIRKWCSEIRNIGFTNVKQWFAKKSDILNKQNAKIGPESPRASRSKCPQRYPGQGTLLGPSGGTPEAPRGVHFKALNRSIAWGRICDSQFCLAFILFTHKIWKPIPNMQNTCDFVCPHAMLRWAHAPLRPGDALGTLPGHSRGALGRPGNAPEHHFGPQKRPQSEHEKRHFFRDVCL